MIRVLLITASILSASEAAMAGSDDMDMVLDVMRPLFMTRWTRAEAGNQFGSGGRKRGSPL